jgi:hypothetical protein
MRLALQLFGSHDKLRDELNALPDEYQGWLDNRSMPPRIQERLIALIVEQQASRVKAQRHLLDGLKSPN